MKKTITFFLCAMTCVYVYGAEYLSSSFRWNVNLFLEDGLQTQSVITVGQDTIIGGRTYRLVDNYYPMRQENDKIFMCNRESNIEVLLYDFAMQPGDSIELVGDPFEGVSQQYAKVIHTEIITLEDGRCARKIEYEQKYPLRSADIEYVGSSTGGILGVLNLTPSQDNRSDKWIGIRLVLPPRLLRDYFVLPPIICL